MTSEDTADHPLLAKGSTEHPLVTKWKNLSLHRMADGSFSCFDITGRLRFQLPPGFPLEYAVQVLDVAVSERRAGFMNGVLIGRSDVAALVREALGRAFENDEGGQP